MNKLDRDTVEQWNPAELPSAEWSRRFADLREDWLRQEEALQRLASPQSFPRSEDAALLQIEVQGIARAALASQAEEEKP